MKTGVFEHENCEKNISYVFQKNTKLLLLHL